MPPGRGPVRCFHGPNHKNLVGFRCMQQACAATSGPWGGSNGRMG